MLPLLRRLPLVAAPFVLLLAVLAGAPQAAGAAARLDLASAGGKAPAAPVQAGGRLTFTPTVRNAGRAKVRGAKVSAFLSRDSKRDRSDVALGRATLAKAIKGRRRAKASLTFVVPRSTAPGTYRLLVCVAPAKGKDRRKRNDCAAAKGVVRVTAADGTQNGEPSKGEQPAPPAAGAASKGDTPLAPVPGPLPPGPADPEPDPGPGPGPGPGPDPEPEPNPNPGPPPPLDRNGTSLKDATDHLHTGPNPVQVGVEPGTITERRAAVLRGRVLTEQGDLLGGVQVEVLDRPELGRTITRADGGFDMAINGGGQVVVSFEKAGYLPVQRTVDTPWQDYVAVDDVVMIELDEQVTGIDLDDTSTPFHVARGSRSDDGDGERQATLLFPSGTTATMTLPDGSTKPLNGVLNVRATEYTDNGPAAMPGTLPPLTGYTYAADFTIDQALAARATEVRFDKPVVTYVENFIGAPVGSPVPAGYYDREEGRWIPGPDGRVIELVSEAGGMADVSIDEDAAPESEGELAGIGIGADERKELARLYEPGQQLWRVRLAHFTPWDFNWPYGPPPGAVPPELDDVDFLTPEHCDTCKQSGRSEIAVERQSLSEALPLAGTDMTLNYSSDRVPGWKVGEVVEIPLMGSTLPDRIKGIQLEIDIAGQHIEKRWENPSSTNPNPTHPPITPNLKHDFAWDGQDAYDRDVQGRPVATIGITYVYDFNYYEASGDFEQSFAAFADPDLEIFDGRFSCGNMQPGPRQGEPPGEWQQRIDRLHFFCGVPVKKTVRRAIGSWDARRAAALGGWTLSAHHTYDPSERVLYRGDGTRESAESLPLQVEHVAGASTGTRFPDADGEQAKGVDIDYLGDMAVGPDGSMYVYSDGNFFGNLGHQIRRITPDGVIRTIAGSSEHGDPQCDGRPAKEGRLGREVHGIAAAPDGTVYYTATYASGAGVVCKVTTDGRLVRVAGVDDRKQAPAGNPIGDGGPALDARVSDPIDILVGPDGAVYLGERHTATNGWRGRVRRIDDAGRITTYTGGGEPDTNGDDDLGAGEPALEHDFGGVLQGMAFQPDGSLLLAFPTEGVIKRLGPDGIVRRFAGNRRPNDRIAYGQTATAAAIGAPMTLAVGPDGTVYVRSNEGGPGSGAKLSKIDASGTLEPVAGRTRNSCPSGVVTQDGEIAATTCIETHSRGLEVLGDGSVVYTDGRYQINKVARALPGFADDTRVVPSSDGRELYEFDEHGRHLRTIDAYTKAVRASLRYDGAGRLTSITGRDGEKLEIERDGSGKATAIVAPGGQRTGLVVDGDGWLESTTRPGALVSRMTYDGAGRLRTFRKPKGAVSEYDYDAEGRLTADKGPNGFLMTFEREQSENELTVTATTGEGRRTVYRRVNEPDGDRVREVTRADGKKSTTVIGADGLTTTTLADGTVITTEQGTDPRFGSAAPVVATETVKTPKGRTRATTSSREVELADPTDPLSVKKITEKETTDGKTTTLVVDTVARTITATSPEGRRVVQTFDAQGRLTGEQRFKRQVRYGYDGKGRLETISRGPVATQRTLRYGHKANGDLETVTDAIGRVTRMVYDAKDRPTTVEMPGGRTTKTTYDDNGNQTSLTPPGRSAHGVTYTDGDLAEKVTPASIGSTPTETTFAFDDDREIASVSAPGGTGYQVVRDQAGRPKAVKTPKGDTTYTYDDQTGEVASVESADGVKLAWTMDGALIDQMAWSGPVAGRVERDYDASLQLKSFQVNDRPAQAFEYDDDGLLTKAGALTLERGFQTGDLETATIGKVASSWTRDDHQDLREMRTTVDGQERYKVTYTRDGLGRVERRDEVVAGEADRTDLEYDDAGRIRHVRRSGAAAPVATYDYDLNGNRRAITEGGKTVEATFDAQDRILSQGSVTFEHTAAGRISKRTDGADVTTYEYDGRGHLSKVTLPGGKVVEHLYDGEGRRVGRKVNGVLEQGLLYKDPLRPIAQLDGSGDVVAEFVYATGTSLPALMLKDGRTYRLVHDQLGSPRLVIDTATGEVVQRMDFDVWGNVTKDTNPGFQPFGFAGGLLDRDTGLVHFGAREYDPRIGRWTSKDPLGFDSGDTNLYAYVHDDPANRTDPSGLSEVTLSPEAAAKIQEIIEIVKADPEFVRRVDSTVGDLPLGGSAGSIRNIGYMLCDMVGQCNIQKQGGEGGDPDGVADMVCDGIAKQAEKVLQDAITSGRLKGVKTGAATRSLPASHEANRIVLDTGEDLVLDWHATLEVDDPEISTFNDFVAEDAAAGRAVRGNVK